MKRPPNKEHPERLFGPLPEWGLLHFHAHLRPLPEFPALTHVHEAVCAPDHALRPHTHETFEICYIHAGRGEWTAQGRTYLLKPGDLYITKPGEIHHGRTDPRHPYHLFVVGIDPAALPLNAGVVARRALPAGDKDRGPERNASVPVWDAPARDVSRAVSEARTLEADFYALKERVIPGSEGIEQIYRRLLAELDAPCGTDAKARALKVMLVQAMLVELLVFIARCYAARRGKLSSPLPGRTPTRAAFQELLAWLRSRLADPPALAEMAGRVRLSPAHFAVVFKRQTGRTPLEFMTSERIEEAARRLKAPGGVHITDIALDLGFSSSQYFSLVFKKQKGCTPGQFRKRTADEG